ncbi:MAG TPA: dipeptide ABC transporter ATP-binding protein [Gammaproteobacteria bacterium]|nr:dipeptide ABC transporter ATP-binding protein [Gammaproteobacteria bacterium]
MALLEVDNLNVRFATPDGEVHAVKDLSFALEQGETLGIVGESGSGKSQTVMSMIGLLAANGRATGVARFAGRDLLAMAPKELRTIRGRKIAMIFQDPMTSLNPYLMIEKQMVAAVRAHERVSFKAARARCLSMLNAVAIPEPDLRLKRYPHELSGGMRQRVMIATSLLLEPEVLVADEPTTALDVTVQAQILELLKDLKRRFNTAIVLITHDLGVVAGLADRVLVMHGGEIKEQGQVRDVFYRPQHDYTRMLLNAVPRLDSTPPAAPLPAQSGAPLIEVRAVKVHFPVPGRGLLGSRETLRAVDGVDLTLAPGETLGVVGESGSGKSTLARAILKLVPATAGSVAVLGRDLAELSRHELRAIKRNLQVVFQDPLAALNPRMTVGDIVSEPLWTHRPELDAAAVRAEVVDVLRRVGLTGRELNRYSHEFSGGQCQRIGIARALVLKPKVVVCDEPVSALDVSIQREIVRLLLELRRELGLALVFIAHDLAVVRQLSHRVMVMYLGCTMEVASRDDLYAHPRHPYTQALMSAVPLPDPDAERARSRAVLHGELPSPIRPPSGCRFRTRCPYAAERCAAEVPPLRPFGNALVACHFAEEIAGLRAKL